MNNLILPSTQAQQKSRFGALLNFLVGQVQQQLPDGLTCAIVVFSKDTGKYAGYSTPATGETARRVAVHALEQCATKLKKKKFTIDTTEIQTP